VGDEVEDRVDLLQRAGLPGLDLLEHPVGDLGDGLVGDLGADRAREVVLDIADRHPTRTQADDHVVEAVQAPRALRHQRRGERRTAIPWDVQRHVPDR
jgi:hypothetical protein